jgi:hypothetical protein
MFCRDTVDVTCLSWNLDAGIRQPLMFLDDFPGAIHDGY